MADASIQFLLENLGSLIKSEIGLISGVNDDINKLSSNLTTIQSRLQDAEDKQFEDESTRDWLRKLNDLYYEIEDVLDESVTELARLEFKNIISKSIKKISCKDKIARRIKEVRAKLVNVEEESKMFKSSKDTAESSKQSSMTDAGSVLNETPDLLQRKLPANRQTGSLLTNPDLVIGRKEESKDIIDFLVNEDRDFHQLSVLPIIGLGGLGKTTLARLVFNDNRVTEHFDIKLWVCVSDDFDHNTLLKTMIRSATKKDEEGSSLEHLELDALQHKLSQLLHQKRYLLVLDDVWNENQDKWLDLKSQLACGKTGSSIIVTTRLKKVVDIMATTPAHNLKGLSDESCWLLFKERAFGHVEGQHTKLEVIGRQIVKKCVGVPLAATTLGGLLRFERREEEWTRVKGSPIWNLPQEESSILSALRLSYNHLPLAQRQCFAYCAVFPKDFVIHKEELIRQWMAHGYISSDGTSEVEDIGDKIFNELVLRSLFLNVETNYRGRISFQMHDLVHDLAQSIMENKVPKPHAKLDGTPTSSSSIRHVNLGKRYAAFPWRIISVVDCLLWSFTQFNRLRSLDASESCISVPPAIGKLKQLRYLNLSCNLLLKTLPEELCSLWNLKILDLNYCEDLERLPKGMRKLRNLRHLFLEGCKSLSQMPPKIGELTSLKTMSMFIVGEERNNQIRELQSLDLLGGNLEITHLERVKEKYLDANRPILAKKQNLRKLALYWENGGPSRCRETLNEKVMEVLEPHPNVETLMILGFQGKNITLWRGRSNPQIKLVELRIEDCNNCLYLPQALVEFPHLKKLVLSSLPALEYIVEDEGCDLASVKFPVLEELKLFKLENLKGLLKKETGEFFPNLKELTLDNLPVLEYILADEGCDMGSVKFPMLEVLALLGLENLKGLLKKETREFFPNLEILFIRGCSLLSSLPQLPSLVDLRCSNMNITSVGGNKFENLSDLSLTMEAEDVVVPKECLTNNLEYLRIQGAGIDEDILPEEGLQQGLKSLKILSLTSLEELRCLPGRWLSHLTSLEELSLVNWSSLVEIPEEGMKYLMNLKKLNIVCCPELLKISEEGMKCLINLKKLTIGDCPKIESIPSTIQQLTQLETLTIYGCSPELMKRCEKGKGDDWHKIQHIPNIDID